jgi:hypothetical protein
MSKISKRTLAAILLITIAGVAAVGLVWWYTQESGEELKRYSNFGFSFEYPKDMKIDEQGPVEGTVATTDSGILLGELGDGEFGLIKVGWLTTESAPDLEISLDNSFLNLEVEGLIVEKGQFKNTTTINRHEMLCQSFTATIAEAITFHGIGGVWYCNTSKRSFEFILMVMQDEPDALLRFHRYTSSFTCH